jgi:PAS domain S-box-containing protein
MKETVDQRTDGWATQSSDRATPLQALLDGITDHAIFLVDADGLVRTWSEGAARVMGYTREQILGRPVSLFYTPEARALDEPRQVIEAAVREGRHTTEGWRLRADGTQFWANIVLEAIRDANGKLTGIAVMARDFTERTNAREASQRTETQFQLLVQGVIDYAIYMLDPRGNITNWNLGGERIKGYSASEIIGRHYSTFYTEEDRAAGLPQRALGIASREGRYEAEGWRVRKDGTRFWASVIIDRITNDQGEIVGYAKITRDTTERRKAQEAIEKSRADLAQAQKMEAVGQLTGGIAHDFNNLLTIIATNADLLAQPALSEPERRKLIDSIQRASDRGARLTQQLLAFARRQPLRPQRHSIGTLLGNFEAMLRRGAGDSVLLDFDLTDEADLALIDAAQFEAAVLNLIVNARDALPGGGIVQLRTRVTDVSARSNGAPIAEPGRYVTIAVTDHGAGMTPETVGRAFEPFFTTKEPGKGTGLGLSQVYGFVNQSGGFVDVESAVGVGTTVTLYLPCLAPLESDRGTDVAPRQRARTVLVVEDDPDVLDSAITMLKSLGYHVLTAGDAASALATLRRAQPIDILFTDIVMPKGMNGVELARAAMLLRPELKVLLASGYPTAALPLAPGADDTFAFLSKPYRWTELSERLRSIAH